MSVLTYAPINEKEFIKHCKKECGIITTTQDFSYFALNCLFCNGEFVDFDTFIAHMKTAHTINVNKNSENSRDGDSFNNLANSTITIKEEIIEDEADKLQSFLTGLPLDEGINDDSDLLLQVKQEPALEIETTQDDLKHIFNDKNQHCYDIYMLDEDSSDLVEEEEEESLSEAKHKDLGDNESYSHIKDRNMIKFMIDCYRRNTFMWDTKHKQFRNRDKRQEFFDWIMSEFKRKFNINISRNAVPRKWDNLRTVYKRELARMSQENTKISTLWYFKELRFLKNLYGDNCEYVLRRRHCAPSWDDDETTLRLFELLRKNPCFYDRSHPDYRSNEKRAEALQRMCTKLKNYVHVKSIQLSKRISELRFAYSTQKHERLLCEIQNKPFVPSFSYYEHMKFMDNDIAPYKCEQCHFIFYTILECENHNSMMHTEGPSMKGTKYYKCEICTAKFFDKLTYTKHVQRHNDDLLLPSLVDGHGASVDATPSTYACDACHFTFTDQHELNQHVKIIHEPRIKLQCDVPNCKKVFVSRQELWQHTRLHYNIGEFQCDICDKSFRTSKNLSNHRQIHDAIKRFVCKICGSAFAQAAGLYLHKRRHNQPDSRLYNRKFTKK